MCPTLDPIQVNPPKEKVVQTFNEKDIKKIVTDGIVNGDIPLPEVEAGSKVYEHKIVLRYGSGGSGHLYLIPIYSNVSTVVDSAEKLANDILKLPSNSSTSIQAVNSTESFYSVSVVKYGSPSISAKSIAISDGTATTISVTSINDTVTEL